MISATTGEGDLVGAQAGDEGLFGVHGPRHLVEFRPAVFRQRDQPVLGRQIVTPPAAWPGTCFTPLYARATAGADSMALPPFWRRR